jgi:hypothetical protein
VVERRAERGKRNKVRGICSGILFREYLDHVFLIWLALCSLLVAGYLLGLFFESTEENKISLRSVAEYLPDHEASYPRKHYCGDSKFNINTEFLKIADDTTIMDKIRDYIFGK